MDWSRSMTNMINALWTIHGAAPFFDAFRKSWLLDDGGLMGRERQDFNYWN